MLIDREELHIRNALKSCYPKWIFDKVKHDRCQKRKKTIETKKRNKSAQESTGLAVIPYVEGLSETAERILRKYGINTAMKRYRTLRQLLVHPKDQRTVEQTGECVYRIPCHNCDCIYIGETGRNYGKRQEKHRKEVESISSRTFTRSDRKSRAAEMNKSAIADHVAKENHVINWSGAKILERGHRKTRQVKESIWIRKEPNCMNRDGGGRTATDSI